VPAATSRRRSKTDTSPVTLTPAPARTVVDTFTPLSDRENNGLLANVTDSSLATVVEAAVAIATGAIAREDLFTVS